MAERVDPVALFEAFYQACDEVEREKLDGMVDKLIANTHEKGAKYFGAESAKELIMVLTLWREETEQEFKRQQALGSRENALRYR